MPYAETQHFGDKRVCRLCLRCTDYVVEDIASLATLIEYVTKLKVLDGDDLPKYICNQCKMELYSAHGFIYRCVINDRTLRSRGFQLHRDVSVCGARSGENPPDRVITTKATCKDLHRSGRSAVLAANKEEVKPESYETMEIDLPNFEDEEDCMDADYNEVLQLNVRDIISSMQNPFATDSQQLSAGVSDDDVFSDNVCYDPQLLMSKTRNHNNKWNAAEKRSATKKTLRQLKPELHQCKTCFKIFSCKKGMMTHALTHSKPVGCKKSRGISANIDQTRTNKASNITLESANHPDSLSAQANILKTANTVHHSLHARTRPMLVAYSVPNGTDLEGIQDVQEAADREEEAAGEDYGRKVKPKSSDQCRNSVVKQRSVLPATKPVEADKDLSSVLTVVNAVEAGAAEVDGGTAMRKVFQCLICGKSYVYEKCFKKHTLSHLSKPVVGTAASKRKRTLAEVSSERSTRAKARSRLKLRADKLPQSSKKHIKQPLYYCSECDREFVNKAGLGSHMRSHMRKADGKKKIGKTF